VNNTKGSWDITETVYWESVPPRRALHTTTTNKLIQSVDNSQTPLLPIIMYVFDLLLALYFQHCNFHRRKISRNLDDVIASIHQQSCTTSMGLIEQLTPWFAVSYAACITSTISSYFQQAFSWLMWACIIGVQTWTSMDGKQNSRKCIMHLRRCTHWTTELVLIFRKLRKITSLRPRTVTIWTCAKDRFFCS